MSRFPRFQFTTPEPAPRAKAAGRAERPAEAQPPGWQRFVFPLVIVLAAAAAYSNSLHGVFVFDDEDAIVENRSIRALWPPGWLADNTRPLLYLTLAANYAVDGREPWGYHLINVGIHLLAALTLYGLVRRTLELDSPPAERAAGPDSSAWLALVAATWWAVHPLTTASVTYLIQRGEALMGLCYLLVLYGLVRSATAERPWPWNLLAIAACFAGMASKEVMVTAPVAALLFDRWFLAPSWAEVVRRRGWVHLALAASWGCLAVCLANGPKVFATVGFTRGTSWLDYLRTEAGVLLHYLWLAIWPQPLAIDYLWPVARQPRDWLWQGAVVVALLGVTLWLLLSRSPARSRLGFLLAMFFLVLAPTSSFVPLADPAFEHRMYLPLAPLVVLAVLAGFALLRRLAPPAAARLPLTGGLVLAAAVAMLLGVLTWQRNHDYRSELTLWLQTVATRPENARAHDQLSAALLRAGQAELAVHHSKLAVALSPEFANAHNNLGRALDALHAHGRDPAALQHYRQAVELAPDHPAARNNLANALVARGLYQPAIAHYRQVLEAWPDSPAVHYHLGVALARSGAIAESSAEFARASELAAAEPTEHLLLRLPLELAQAETAAQLGQLAKAGEHFRAALQLSPGSADAHCGLGKVLLATGDVPAAQSEFEAALRARPSWAEPYLRLANIEMAAGSPAGARRVYERLLVADPRHADGHFTLALLAADAGEGAKAVKHLRQALDARPEWPAAMIELAWLLAVDPSPDVRSGNEAVELAEAAERLAPESPRAWDALGAAYAEAGNFAAAQKAADRALDLGEKQKLDDGDLSQMTFRRQLYQMGMRFRAARSQP